MGFASGFQVGSQAVERGIKLREEEQLKQQLADVYKAPTSGLNYTSDQMAEMRRMQGTGSYDIEAVPGAEGQAPTLRYTPKQGLDYGDAGAGLPTDFAPQQVQMYGGRSVAGQFDPAALQGLQARRAAEVVGASGDFRGAAQLQADALRMEREAQEAPLRFQNLRQQVTLGGQQIESGVLDIDAKQRARAANIRTDSFNTWQAANPNATPTEMFTEARRLGMPVDEQFKIASSVTGLKETSLKNNELAIKEMVQNKSLDQLTQMHKDNDLLDPGSHFEVIRDKKNGQVTLQRVDSKTGKAMGGPTFTGSEAEATRYLYTAATAPETVVDFTTNLDKAKAAIAASKATLTSAMAQANAANARVNLTKSQQTQLDELNDARKKALGFAEKFEELDEKDKAGEKGRNLIKQFNLYNSKAGGQTGLERMQAPEKRVSDAAVASYAKDLVGKPTGRRVNGVLERYTAETAAAAARRALADQGEDTQGAPDWKP
jgi:hypothetical protein